jgi:hypothetical protein
MYFLLILFFGSLFGITFMIGRKLMVLQEGVVVHHNENLLKDSYEEWKRSVAKNFKKYSYLGLVATIRFYIHSLNFAKKQYEVVKIKAKDMIAKKSKNNDKKIEPNKFLKMISEYKHKIRKIRHQIKEEENL